MVRPPVPRFHVRLHYRLDLRWPIRDVPFLELRDAMQFVSALLDVTPTRRVYEQIEIVEVFAEVKLEVHF